MLRSLWSDLLRDGDGVVSGVAQLAFFRHAQVCLHDYNVLLGPTDRDLVLPLVRALAASQPPPAVRYSAQSQPRTHHSHGPMHSLTYSLCVAAAIREHSTNGTQVCHKRRYAGAVGECRARYASQSQSATAEMWPTTAQRTPHATRYSVHSAAPTTAPRNLGPTTRARLETRCSRQIVCKLISV